MLIDELVQQQSLSLKHVKHDCDLSLSNADTAAAMNTINPQQDKIMAFEFDEQYIPHSFKRINKGTRGLLGRY